MENKKIITYLIMQEMKYTQLIKTFEKIGFITDLHTISLLEVFQPLLGIPTPEQQEFPEISDQLGELYYNYLLQSEGVAITMLGKELEPLAEECYQLLVACVHMESRRR